MFDDLKRNLEQEKKIVADIRSISVAMASDLRNRDFYISSLNALAEQLVYLNNAVPELLKNGFPIKKDVEKSSSIVNVKPDATVKMSYVSPATKEKKYITINEKDKKEFLKKLKLSEDALVSIKKLNEENTGTAVQAPSFYVKISNRFFLDYSEKLTPKFDDLSRDLKKSNIRFLLSSYLSMAIMSSVIAFLFGFLIFAVLMVFSFSNWIYFILPFGFAGFTLAGFYLYPASEADSVNKRISQELPFATIHMAAIAGSNIEPTKILKIIAMSGEYPNIAKEMKKVLVQVNIYGYDLLTSLKNVAGRTSNKRLAELFSGLATNISSGGALKNYLENKSENFLADYKLERQKYSALAGTFMDVYISILIAAPLILMMMFIVMNSIGLGMGGLSIMVLLFLSVVAIVIVNVIFIVVLNIKQPKV